MRLGATFGLSGGLFHLDADEARLEANLPGIDFGDAELRRDAFAADELERLAFYPSMRRL